MIPYRVRTQYVFEGVFEVVATDLEEAERKILEDCGMVMGRREQAGDQTKEAKESRRKNFVTFANELRRLKSNKGLPIARYMPHAYI